MKKRRFEKLKLNNEGYSLIELIIVIAIIVVLTGAAALTVGTINSARAREAAVTFESELATFISSSKNKACDVNGDGIISDEELNTTSSALKIYEEDERFYVQKVVKWNGYYTSNPVYEKANNAHDGKGTRLSSNVVVKYTPIGGTEQAIGSGNNAVYIEFSKNGSCVVGAGTYTFYKTDGTKISTVTINKNGSHKSN